MLTPPAGGRIVYPGCNSNLGPPLPAGAEAVLGTFNVYIGVGHPEGGDVEQVLALVDTGATHSVLPASLLEWLHIRPYDRQSVAVADNSEPVWEVGKARLVYRDREWVCPVVFGPEDQYLMGATTLELFGLVVDPGRKELVPAIHVARPF